MTTRETSFQENDHPGNDFPGNVFPGKKPSGKVTIRETTVYLAHTLGPLREGCLVESVPVGRLYVRDAVYGMCASKQVYI